VIACTQVPVEGWQSRPAGQPRRSVQVAASGSTHRLEALQLQLGGQSVALVQYGAELHCWV
jgi:hypothetical protein